MTHHAHTSAITHVDESTFDYLIQASPFPILVRFGSESCPPCRMIEPYLEFLARLYAGRAFVVEVDTEQSKQLCSRYDVQGVPHLVALTHGHMARVEVSRHNYAGVGLAPFRVVHAWVSGRLFGPGEEVSAKAESFAAITENAWADYRANLLASSEYRQFARVWQPFAQQYEEDLAAADAALSTQKIDSAEHGVLAAAAQKRNAEAFGSEQVQPALAAFRAVQAERQGELTIALLGVVDRLFRLSHPAARVKRTPEGVCRIGDADCIS